jgi:hypothetical protein
MSDAQRPSLAPRSWFADHIGGLQWDFRVCQEDLRGDSTAIDRYGLHKKGHPDRMMQAIADQYPGYNFEANKGYPCPAHASCRL